MFEYVHHVAYVVNDMDDAVRVLGNMFELEVVERCVTAGVHPVEMTSFRCGPSLLEVLRPIDHPELEAFLRDHGPGLHHVAFAVKDLDQRIDALRAKGCYVGAPFVAGTGWRIAYFDLERSGLALFGSHYHGDHLAEAR